MKHIILIGFKHTGKTAIGGMLAEHLDLPHLDLDDLIEASHTAKKQEQLNCRQIVLQHGIDHFRNLEKEVLQEVLHNDKLHVLSVGGGTPLDEGNRNLLSEHRVVHVVAPRGIVFERIMINGKPAFFPDNGTDFEAFSDVWDERVPIFESIAHNTVENDGSIVSAVEKIISSFRMNPLEL